MSGVFVRGTGAVSPAGWGVEPLCSALQAGQPWPVTELRAPAGRVYRARMVPPPMPRPAWLAHPRLRRADAVSQFALAAAQEALAAASVKPAGARLGIVTATQVACLRYSERFFGEVLREPSTASPLLFPETVINAPASHLAACLGGADLTYSLIGDETTFLQALSVAADWLVEDRAELSVVVGADEAAWPLADALEKFARGLVSSEGAGALALAREPGPGPAVALERITAPQLYAGQVTKLSAAQAMRREFPPEAPGELLLDARCGVRRVDWAEQQAWRDWTGPRLSPRAILGEALCAATAWQCVAACAALARGEARAANVSVVGGNEAAMGARFVVLAEPDGDVASPPV